MVFLLWLLDFLMGFNAFGIVHSQANQIFTRHGINFDFDFDFENDHIFERGYRFKPGQFVISGIYSRQYFYTVVAKANHPFYEQSIQKGLETLYQIID